MRIRTMLGLALLALPIPAAALDLGGVSVDVGLDSGGLDVGADVGGIGVDAGVGSGGVDVEVGVGSPSEPSQPSEPSTPSTPDSPSQPSQPSQPDTPSQPTAPQDGGQTSSPPSTGGSGGGGTTTAPQQGGSSSPVQQPVQVQQSNTPGGAIPVQSNPVAAPAAAPVATQKRVARAPLLRDDDGTMLVSALRADDRFAETETIIREQDVPDGYDDVVDFERVVFLPAEERFDAAEIERLRMAATESGHAEALRKALENSPQLLAVLARYGFDPSRVVLVQSADGGYVEILILPERNTDVAVVPDYVSGGSSSSSESSSTNASSFPVGSSIPRIAPVDTGIGDFMATERMQVAACPIDPQQDDFAVLTQLSVDPLSAMGEPYSGILPVSPWEPTPDLDGYELLMQSIAYVALDEDIVDTSFAPVDALVAVLDLRVGDENIVLVAEAWDGSVCVEPDAVPQDQLMASIASSASR